MDSNFPEFVVANSFPEPMRQFLMGSTDQRRDDLVGKVETLQRYFSKGADGQPKLCSIMNSPDLASPPDKTIPENGAFKNEVKEFFREIVALQIDMEADTDYGVRAIDDELCTTFAGGSQTLTHAWVIGAKLDETREEGAACLSMGDALVGRLVRQNRVGHVWSTSRSKQDATHTHTHFSADLDNIQKHDFRWQMSQIDAKRLVTKIPLVVYFVFGNTGSNSENNPASGKHMNRSNIDATISFLEAAQEAGWLADQTVSFVVVSTFHCSPTRSNYNDKLHVPPSAEAFNGEHTEEYKKAAQAAMQSAGLLEYTSSKFAQAALFAAALTTSDELRCRLEEYVEDIEKLHRKLGNCPFLEYKEISQWVLVECREEIQRIQQYCDHFFEDTAGNDAIVRRSDLQSRMAVVKIPFALTTMIATRAARVSVLTNVLSMNDTWIRTKMRLGWAISPQTGAAWLEHAAMRMQSRLGRAALDTSDGAKQDVKVGADNGRRWNTRRHGTIDVVKQWADGGAEQDVELGEPQTNVPRLLGRAASRDRKEFSPRYPADSNFAKRSRECYIRATVQTI